MILAPIIAVDLGHAGCAAGLFGGTPTNPVLLEAVRRSRFDDKIIAAVVGWQHRFEGEVIEVWCEGTFTGKYRDVGRVQETQAVRLAEAAGQLHRVFPVDAAEAHAAWQMCGRPAIGEGRRGEHARDLCGIGVKGLSRNRKGESYLWTTEQYPARVKELEKERRGRPARRARR